MSEKLSVVLGKEKSELKISNGTSYAVRPLNMDEIAEAEEYFGCDLEGFEAALKRSKNITFLIFLALRQAVPEITSKEVASLFTLNDLNALAESKFLQFLLGQDAVALVEAEAKKNA